MMRARFPAERVVLLIFLLAFALRMVVAVNNLETALAPDEREYMNRAALVATDVWQDRAVFRPPLYPYTIAVLYDMVGSQRFIVNTFHALLDTLSTALIYVLTGALLARRRVAALAALIFAISPQSIGLSGALLSEPLFICLMLAGFVLVTRAANTRSLLTALGGGALLGLAALTREVVAYFALLAVPAWWLVFIQQPLRTRLSHSVALLAGVVLILAPWAFRNYRVEGRLLLLSTSGEYVFARDNMRVERILRDSTPVDQATQDAREEIRVNLAALAPGNQARYLYERGLEAIRDNGLYWLGYKASVVGGFWSVSRFERVNLGVAELPAAIEPGVSMLIRGYFLALIALATFGLIAAPNSPSKLLIALFILYSLLLFLLTHYQLRYRYPMHVLATPYAAYGAWVAVKLAQTRHFSAGWITAPRFLVALVTFLCFVPLID